MGKQMKRNNSVPEEIDKLPEIQIRKRDNSILQQEIDTRSNRAPVSKNLEDSFKKMLDPIKEDRDDDYFKYKDDFEPADIENRVMGIVNLNNKILEMQLNPRSAEPHLHKTKVLNL